MCSLSRERAEYGITQCFIEKHQMNENSGQNRCLNSSCRCNWCWSSELFTLQAVSPSMAIDLLLKCPCTKEKPASAGQAFCAGLCASAGRQHSVRTDNSVAY